MCTPEMKIRILRPLRLKRDTEELTVKIFPDKEPDPETDAAVTQPADIWLVGHRTRWWKREKRKPVQSLLRAGSYSLSTASWA